MKRCHTPLKRPYSTRKIAKRAAVMGMRARQVKLEVYHCPSCRFWHLTSRISAPVPESPRQS